MRSEVLSAGAAFFGAQKARARASVRMNRAWTTLVPVAAWIKKPKPTEGSVNSIV